MTFDIAVGNPPYNDDIYIDFVIKGNNISTLCSLWITPAKWQAKSDDKNEKFREEVAPYISKIVYYPNCEDLFSIKMPCGINHYIITKQKCLSISITCNNRSKTINNWIPAMGTDLDYIDIIEKILNHRDSNGNKDFLSITTPRDIRFLPQKSYFTSKNFGDVEEDKSSKFYMWSSVRNIRVSESSFNHLYDMDKYKVYCNHSINNIPLAHIVGPNTAAVRESCLMGYGTLDECRSVQSYYHCRLIWYLVYGMKVGNICTEAFKFVPDPGPFDHIFTDAELYEKYNLTSEEIEIIESVIKERKMEG